MPRKKPEVAKNAAKYFVPPVRRIPKESVGQGKAKYFERTYPLPDELSEIWLGSGPDLPEGYEGAEACPDCSSFKYSSHAPLCIRNPNQKTFYLPNAWGALHTMEQIFFGVGHPILKDVDGYMTVAKQERLTHLNVIVLYDWPVEVDGASNFRAREVVSGWKGNTDDAFETRQVIAHWRRRHPNRNGQ